MKDNNIENLISKEELIRWQTDVEFQKRMVKENPYNISLTLNPSEDVCLVAVEQDGYSLKCIHNPSEDVCLTAVRDTWEAIQFIHNPSEEICLEAVKQNGLAVQCVPNPSEEMCFEAIKHKLDNIQHVDIIKYPRVYNEYFNRQSLEKMRSEATFIQWQSDTDFQKRMVKIDPYNIAKMLNPSEEVCLAAMKYSGNIIKYIHSPSEKVRLAAVKRSGVSIQFIHDPSEEMCLTAVKQNWNSLQYIHNPSEKVCIEAVRKNLENIRYIDIIKYPKAYNQYFFQVI